MIKINLNFGLKNLDGSLILEKEEAVKAKVVLANCIARSNPKSFTSVKGYSISKRLFNDCELELDCEDANHLRKFVDHEADLICFVKGQIIEVIDKAINTPQK